MTPEERGQILGAFARLGVRADAEVSDPLTTFLPLGPHRRALSPEYVVVLGGRGTGKTALFRLVNDPRTAPRLRDFFQDKRIPEATWIDAFSSAALHPEVGTLEAYAASASDIRLRAFWMTHLLRRVREGVPNLAQVPPELEPILGAPAADLAAWLPSAEQRLGAVNAALDAVDRALESADHFVMATYDNLDRIGQFDPGIRRRYLSTLLALWLSLASRYRRLRGKLFLRDDLVDAGELGFADASKLRSRSETLAWDAAGLLRAAARYLAGESEAARAWLRAVPGLELVDRGAFGWMPGEMTAEVQMAFVGRFAGKVIGRGVAKGTTSEWIMGRLRDAHGRITPRVMLSFLAFAAQDAENGPPRQKGPLVTPENLLAALRQTSRERVQELLEEYPLVKRVENLRGMTLWMDRAQVLDRLASPRSDEPPGIPAAGDTVLAELLRLGVLRQREEAKIDVPDIYRYWFEITPDYSTAWRDLLIGDEQRAREQFIRELPILQEILKRVTNPPNVGAEEIQRGDFAAARARCERALEYASDADQASLQASLWWQLAVFSVSEGKWERASEEFRRAIELAREAPDIQKLAYMLWMLGNNEFLMGKLEASTSHLQEGIATARRLGDPYPEIMCRLNLSVALLFLRAFDDAQTEFDHYRRLLAAFPDERKLGGELWFLEHMSNLVRSRNRLRQALQFLSIAASKAQTHGDDNASRLASARDKLAAQMGLSAAELEALHREAEALFDRDQGWSLLSAPASEPSSR